MAAHNLLVEDEVKLARFVELELSSEGYQISVAHDGITGLKISRLKTAVGTSQKNFFREAMRSTS